MKRKLETETNSSEDTYNHDCDNEQEEEEEETQQESFQALDVDIQKLQNVASEEKNTKNDIKPITLIDLSSDDSETVEITTKEKGQPEETKEEEIRQESVADSIRDIDDVLQLGYKLLRKNQLFVWKFFIQDMMTGNKVIQTLTKQRHLIIAFTFASTASLDILKDTIKHEICHILVGQEEKHNLRWQEKAKELKCNANIGCRFDLSRSISQRNTHNKNMTNTRQKQENHTQPLGVTSTLYKFTQGCSNGCWSKKLTRRPAGFANDLFKFHCNQCRAFIEIKPI